jgi:hypothetical protein
MASNNRPSAPIRTNLSPITNAETREMPTLENLRELFHENKAFQTEQPDWEILRDASVPLRAVLDESLAMQRAIKMSMADSPVRDELLDSFARINQDSTIVQRAFTTISIKRRLAGKLKAENAAKNAVRHAS